MKRAVCPGSFDPVTYGHVDVIRRASALFDEVVVAIVHNPSKAGRFDPSQRRDFVLAQVSDLPNVSVMAFEARLLVDICRDLDALAIVKGVRDQSDYAYELQMAVMNRHLTGVETLFIPADPQYIHVSSSLVREIARYDGDLDALVPPEVAAALTER